MILSGLGIYLPDAHHDAAHIAAASGVPEAIVRDKLGIVKKTVPGAGDHTNAMGIHAARAALADAGVAASEVDVLIGITEEHKEKMRAYMKKYRAIRHFLLFIVLAGEKCGSDR